MTTLPHRMILARSRCCGWIRIGPIPRCTNCAFSIPSYPKGVLIIDDYGHWEGCKRAVHEFFGNDGSCSLLQSMRRGGLR